ncbi:MAG: Sua5/YciO/YrdC/YwlC family protein, partial [Coriobacteriales bacterium]|nr:Sua5/YciO/YrdC/YwlC family protein [Coriobacteriales bacterium]
MSADVDLEALRHGRCLLIATDTVYGLAALPGSEGYGQIFQLKQRPAGQVLPWLIADASQLERWAAEPPAYALRLAAALWPGGLPLVLRAAERARARG